MNIRESCPILDDSVRSVFVEATAEQTEPRLLTRLRRLSPMLSPDLSLSATIAELRKNSGAGQKILLVIDQFEQWLHAVPDQEHSELALALRQCDGEHVQCILMIRDDFWLAFSRFMGALEIELAQNRNMRLVDLFDKMHGRRVLAEYGRAYMRLPRTPISLRRIRNSF